VGNRLFVKSLKGLRVAVLAPITWPTPPPGYGPWEQIAFNIAGGMRARGLDVTLFATGNSQFEGGLESVVPVGTAQDPALNHDVFSALHIGRLMERANDFDLIHNNFDWKPMTYALATKAPPVLTTIHGFSTPQILAAYYACAWRCFYTSISDSDRDPGLSYLATTYNGIDPQEFTFNAKPGEYLVFLGRFHPEKGTHLAIEIAKRSGKQLKIAAIPHDDEYFHTLVQPHLDGEQIVYLGEVHRKARNELLGNALALVHMTTRPERFGLTMVEAMACGTPVLGARMGSIPEIVVDGVTGFLCDDVADAVSKVPLLSKLDRAACRAHVEATFSVEHMIDRYLEAYATAVERRLPAPATPEQLRWRRHDWWDRPMGYTEIPAKPSSLSFDEVRNAPVNGS
jgi:glycosyltransferase involved in cell wall biosynthesis